MLPDPDEGVVELGVDGLQVLQQQLLVEHALVEGQREACVDELAVEQRLSTAQTERQTGRRQRGDRERETETKTAPLSMDQLKTNKCYYTGSRSV